MENGQAPVGIKEIAERLGVREGTVIMWRHRSSNWVRVPPFPTPKGEISGRPWWWWSDIETWAKESGREALLHPNHDSATLRSTQSEQD